MAVSMTFPGDMRLDVRLCPGVESRLLRVTARWRDDSGSPPLPAATRKVSEIGARFVAGVDAGLFQGPKEGQRAELLHASARTDGQGIHRRMGGDDSAARHRRSGGARADDLEHGGRGADPRAERARSAAHGERSLDVAPRTERVPPWEVVNEAAKDKDVVVTVCFEQDAPPEVVRATHATLTAWADVVAAGGFGGRSFPVSGAVLSELGTELESEVFASFEALSVRHEGWGALWAGLRRIHMHARIERVEIG